MSKVEDFIAATKLSELVNKKEEDKHGKTVLWVLAIVGTVAALSLIHISAIEKTEEFFRALDMPVSIGELSIGVQPDEVLKKMAESATKGDTVKLGCFKRLDMQDMYEIYKMANHQKVDCGKKNQECVKMIILDKT